MTSRQNRLQQSSGNDLSPIFSLLKGVCSSLNLKKVGAISLVYSSGAFQKLLEVFFNYNIKICILTPVFDTSIIFEFCPVFNCPVL